MSTVRALLLRSAELDEEQARIKRQLAEELSTKPITLDDATIYGSRAPYPPPPGRGRSERGARRWLRQHGPELRAFGAERRGGRSGSGVVWTIPGSGLRAFDAASLKKTNDQPAAPASNVIDVDAWISRAGYRLTRRGGAR